MGLTNREVTNYLAFFGSGSSALGYFVDLRSSYEP